MALQEYDETTPNEEVLESPEEAISEGTVPESRYHESIKEMNKKQRENAELRKKIAELESKNTTTPELESTPMPETEAEGESESMAMLREDLPELANALDDLKAFFDKRLSEIEKSHGQLMGDTKKRYWNDVNRAVPNLKDFVETPEFDDWWSAQTPEIQAQLVSPDPIEVASALKLYTADTGEVLEPDVESEQQAPNVTAIELNVGKPKPDKMEMAKKMAAPNIKPSNGGKLDEPFKMLSPEERAALLPEQLSVYAAKMREYMSKGKR
jgi:hypothetical protein